MTGTRIWLLLIGIVVVLLGAATCLAIGVMRHGADVCGRRYGVELDGGTVIMTKNGDILILYGVKKGFCDYCGFSLWPYGTVSRWMKMDDLLIRNDK